MLELGSEPDLDCFTTFFNTLSNTTTKNKNKIQRRFTDRQIKSLETIFQSESKLEPRKKLQLAKDLGLQPRQVAIWFQNKRARWKSKQLERDYNVLKANYDSLSSRFDLIKRENQSLTLQLKKLHELIEKKAKNFSADEDLNNSTEEKASLSFAGSEKGLGILSDADSGVKSMIVMEQGDGDNWDDLEPNPLLLDDTTSQWWDFWC